MPSVAAAPTQDPLILPESPPHLPSILAPSLAPGLLVLPVHLSLSERTTYTFLFFFFPSFIERWTVYLGFVGAPHPHPSNLHLWFNYLSCQACLCSVAFASPHPSRHTPPHTPFFSHLHAIAVYTGYGSPFFIPQPFHKGLEKLFAQNFI